jgi:hypothetical protein
MHSETVKNKVVYIYTDELNSQTSPLIYLLQLRKCLNYMTSSGIVTINDKAKIVWKGELLVYFECNGLWQKKTKTRFNYDRCPGWNSMSS